MFVLINSMMRICNAKLFRCFSVKLTLAIVLLMLLSLMMNHLHNKSLPVVKPGALVIDSYSLNTTVLNNDLDVTLQKVHHNVASVQSKKTATSDDELFRHGRTVENVVCVELFNGNRVEMQRALKVSGETQKVNVKPATYIAMTANCSEYIRTRDYIVESLTEEEKNFPIAYSIVMYSNVEQFERLLRAIYRPQNIYCVHVDGKADEEIFKGVKAVSTCFPNVIIPRKRISVTWAEISVLRADLVCMTELYHREKQWKYFINLTGQEFPLKTNYELVKILTAYNGANDIQGTRRSGRDRWKNTVAPPHGIVPTKGAVHVAVSRGFVEFALFDDRARDLLAWLKNTIVPDETFFSSLNNNPHLQVPGSPKEFIESSETTYPYLSRFKNWGDYECGGKFLRDICIFGVSDLPLLAARKELFANKFLWDNQRVVYECLEEWLYNRTREEYFGRLDFDASWYGLQGFVLNKQN